MGNLFFTFHRIGPVGRLGLVVAMSVCVCVFLCVPFPCDFFRSLIGPQIVAGSIRQQPVGRINQVAHRGDGDKDVIKMEIKMKCQVMRCY